MQPAKVIPLSAGLRAPRSEDTAALRFWELGQVDEAIAAWQELLKQDPEQVNYRKRLARAYMFLGRWEAASRELNLCLPLELDSPDLLARIAICHLHTGERTNAWLLFEQALRLNSSHRLAAAALLTRPAPPSLSLVPAAGILSFEEEAAAAGDTPYPVSDDLFQQARMRIGNHQCEAAEELLEEAVLIDPSHAPSLFALARLAEMRGRDAWARRYYERAIRCAPQSWQAHYNLARLYVLEGADSKARQHLERAILLNPESLDAIWLLAQVCERELDIGEAQVWLDHLRKADPRNAEVCVALARVDPPNAHRYLEAAVAMGCQRYEVLFNLGVCRWRAGDTGGAEAAWRSAASVPGAPPEAAHALSALAISGRNLNDAGSYLQQHPHSGLLCLLAHLHEEMGNPDKAAEAWKKAIELDPEFSRRYFA